MLIYLQRLQILICLNWVIQLDTNLSKLKLMNLKDRTIVLFRKNLFLQKVLFALSLLWMDLEKINNTVQTKLSHFGDTVREWDTFVKEEAPLTDDTMQSSFTKTQSRSIFLSVENYLDSELRPKHSLTIISSGVKNKLIRQHSLLRILALGSWKFIKRAHPCNLQRIADHLFRLHQEILLMLHCSMWMKL